MIGVEDTYSSLKINTIRLVSQKTAEDAGSTPAKPGVKWTGRDLELRDLRSLRPNRKELPTKYRLISPGSGGIKPANDNTVAVYLDDSDCFTRVHKGPIGYDIDILVSEFDLSSRSQR